MCYIDFIVNNNQTSINNENYKNVIFVKSFSKFNGLPSIRLGYCIANNNICSNLKKSIIYYNVNVISQYIAYYSLLDNNVILV